MDNDLLHQIVHRYVLGKVTKFGCSSLIITKRYNVERQCGQNPL